MKTKRFEQYQDFMGRLLGAQSRVEGLETPDVVKTVTFQVTDGCNLRCTYCYQINKNTRVMSFDVAKQFFDLLIEDSYKDDTYVSIKTTPGIVVEFIGGEPLLEIELIDQITDYIRWKLISENHPWANKVIFSMISNGVKYFSKEVQEYLTKNIGYVSFGISLDGCKGLHDMCRVFPDGTGSYDLAEAGCKHYMANFDSNMLTKLTVAPANITWLYEAFLNLYDLGYRVIHANCVYEKGWEIEHAKILYEQLKKIADHIIENDLEEEVYFRFFDENDCKPMQEEDNQNYCGSTGCMLACDPDGTICPCIRFMKSSLGDEIGDFALGTICDGIGKKEEHKNNICTLDSITRRSQSTDECWNCPIAVGCGHCTAYNYQETGTPNKRCTYICWMHRARSLANVYYWNKVYKKHKENIEYEIFLPKDLALQIIDEDEYDLLYSLSQKEEE
jgi:radical SAM peptide maturase (CXXX-repeat target family)